MSRNAMVVIACGLMFTSGVIVGVGTMWPKAFEPGMLKGRFSEFIFCEGDEGILTVLPTGHLSIKCADRRRTMIKAHSGKKSMSNVTLEVEWEGTIGIDLRDIEFSGTVRTPTDAVPRP